jgi:hypothetical protein
VGRRGDRACHALPVDVAEVGQGEPEHVECGVQRVQPGAGGHPHQAGGAVHGEHAREPVELQQQTVGGDEVAEGVPGAGDPHGLTGRAGVPHRGGQFLDRPRPHDGGRGAALVPGPVDPRHGEQHAASQSSTCSEATLLRPSRS